MKKFEFDGTIYWEAGDKAMVRYFGNDDSRDGTMCEVEVVKVDEAAARYMGNNATGLVTVRLYDSFGNTDNDGNPREYFDGLCWSTELEEIPAT
jgi:hypothetical protein